MSRSEEDMLHELFKDSRTAQEQVSESLLNEAALKGTARAQRSKNSIRKVVRWTGVGATLFVILLFISLRMSESSTPIAPQSLPTPILFKAEPEVIASIKSNSAWLQAANQGLYQPIHRTQENKGYKVTVSGVLADNRRLIIFVTTTKLSGVALHRERATFTDRNHTSLDASYAPFLETTTLPNGSTRTRGYYVLDFYGQQQTPDMLNINLWGADSETSIDRELVRLQLNVDASRFIHLDQVIRSNQRLLLNRHDIAFNRLIVGPLHSELELTYLDTIQESIHSFIKPHLSIGTQTFPFQGSAQSSSASGPNHLFFESIYYVDHSAVTFQADGWIQNTAQSMTMKLNTDTKQLIQVPDGRTTIKDVIHNTDYLELQFSVEKEENSQAALSSQFVIAQQYTDASGKVYQAISPDPSPGFPYAFTEDSNSKRRYLYHYFIKNISYNQPLTFTPSSYPGISLIQPIHIQLKKAEDRK
ncbi:hypothetical protein J2Z69_002451 [Paenibacillus shirakamiensis]|uniref:DUF4179 domain-containing protein n=1 Tax=Paenibacillus shirakamiensis TaxID=1265935 RepID=A0ABS4JJY1_9BACL|nr:DUF4179 domain-containing protein [Paenibacillus shirakamiensis]MBP2001406.1 hypothetical protein [Paenibacillus shirakamiensis]